VTNQKLRSYILKFIPLLKNNHSLATSKWKNGELSKAAYDHINQRYVVATHLNKRHDVKDEYLIEICSEITIDLHAALEVIDESEKEMYAEFLKEWYICFHEIGFIDIHPVFSKPEKNLTAYEEFEKKHKGK
jgi:hypothetical protein